MFSNSSVPIVISRRDAAEQEREKASLENPTPEMWRIITMRRSQEEERERLGWRDQLEVFQKRSANHKPVILHYYTNTNPLFQLNFTNTNPLFQVRRP